MYKKTVSRIMLILLLIGMLFSPINVKTARSTWTGTVYIRADGSIDPPDAPITTYDNMTYILKDDIIGSIIVERDNIIVDGAGYTLQGSGPWLCGINLNRRNNVIVRNINLTNIGFCLENSSNIIIKENNMTNSTILLDNCCNNTIYQNNLVEGYIGLYMCQNSTIHRNNLTYTDIFIRKSLGNKILENEITNAVIDILESSNSILCRNYIKSKDCVRIYKSSFNEICENNMMSENGIVVEILNSFAISVRNNAIIGGVLGIWISDYSRNITILQNKIRNSSFLGIDVTGSFNITITRNNITNHRGIRVTNYSYYIRIRENNVCADLYDIHINESSYNTICANNITEGGIILSYSYNNCIRGNNISDNDVGIILHDYSSENSISENNISNNDYGILLESSSNNIIYGNNVTNNIYGIVLYYSSNNLILHNNFINNCRQASSYNSTNVWDNGYPSGGNYWSDYIGNDAYSGPYQNEIGSDGIGDAPYVIDEDNVDRYPLMSPWGELPALIPTLTVAPSYYLATHAGETFNVTIRIQNLSAASRAVGFQFRLSYNDTLLEVVNVAEGSFLRQFNQTASPPYTFFVYYIEPETQYPNGTVIPPHVVVGILLMPNSTGDWPGPFPEGNGTLASITFNVTAESAGSCILHLFDTIILNDEGEEIDHNVIDGLFEFKPAPLVINATVDVNPQALNLRSKGKWITAYIELPEGYNVSDIDVSTIMLNDTVPVDLSAPIAIGDFNNDTIPDLMVCFNWTEVTDYILSEGMVFGNVSLEISGRLFDGTIFTGTDTILVSSLIGDVNVDGAVDIQDILVAALSFGSYPTHPRWNPNADFTKDSYIGIDDICLTARNFGKQA